MTDAGLIRVGVLGVAGRMGRAVADAVTGADGMVLAAAADPSAVGTEVHGVTVATDVEGLLADASGGAVDVVVDFTVAESSRCTLPVLAAAGVHAVVGTSGLGDDDLADLRGVFMASNCVVVPNFAIGAVLMMRFAEMAAPWFDTAEIVEIHHDGKVDAPSGTATATAERMAAASADWAPDPTTREVVPGARGGVGPADIHIHSLRMRGAVADQEVVLGTTGQTLAIRHYTTDRASFMPGVVLAVRRISDVPGVTLGLDALLGL
jgi:4-hydroxy-tetrahydrodipicolinate reductase